ncbi:MAG: hypothetical protein AAFV33_15230 [Chloroflexota bacterium]
MNIVRVMQIAIVLLICPMVTLGLMSGLSGGGMTPAFQIIGGRLMGWSVPLVLACVGLAELIYRRTGQLAIAAALCLIPIGVWAWLVVSLQQQTGFFY